MSGRGWAQRLSKDQGSPPQSQGGSQCHFPRFPYKCCYRDLPHTGGCVGFVVPRCFSVTTGSHPGRFQICSGWGMRSAELLQGWQPKEWDRAEPEVGWGLFRPAPFHNYLPHLLPQVVWSCNKWDVFSKYNHHHLCFIHFRQNPSRNSQETGVRLQIICRECYQSLCWQMRKTKNMAPLSPENSIMDSQIFI